MNREALCLEIKNSGTHVYSNANHTNHANNADHATHATYAYAIPNATARTPKAPR